MGQKENAVVDALQELKTSVEALDTTALEAAMVSGTRNIGEGAHVLQEVNALKSLIAGQTAHAQGIAQNVTH